MYRSKFKLIALIPARSGSQRIKHKNIISFYNHPLIAYTIDSAIKSKIFDKIFVSTNSKKYSQIAKYYGADVSFLRPNKLSKSTSSDFKWIKFTLDKLKKKKLTYSHFFILRPTNPFRNEKTIIKAWNLFKKNRKAESLRAVNITKIHPGKMWMLKSKMLAPLQKYKINGQPSYNNQFKVLPDVYVQNASLEISKSNVINKYKTITGKYIIPYFSNDTEAIDINYNEDISKIKLLIKNKKLKKPIIKKKSFF